MLEKSKQLFKQIDQWLAICQKRNQHIVTNFFTPEDLALIIPYLQSRIPFVVDGGINNFERAKLILNVVDKTATDVVVIAAKINPKYVEIAHKDVLGTLMGMGIQRETIGDIVIDDNLILVVTNQVIGQYLIENCLQIKRFKVTFNYYDEKYTRIYHYDILHLNVASLRMDAIVAALAKTSREKAQQLIKNKMVVINHQTLEDIKRLCHNNDIISIRKVGKFVFKQIEKTTKKERLIIEVWKYI